MKATTSTIIRTIVLMLTLANTILTACGINPLPFSDDELYEGVSAVVMTAAALWAWWKNNSFTPEAIMADRYKEELKNGAAE